MILGLEFPPVSHVTEWPTLFGGDVLGVNKVVLLLWISVVLVFGFYFIASRKQQLVPTGIQNVAESAVDFVRNGIILQTMGTDGLFYTPFLLTMFSFIFVCNVWEIIPFVQMPVNARIALPLVLALVVWVMYFVVGFKNQGFFGYLKAACVPPGVPKPIIPLVFLIEFVGLIITRPLSLCLRLFANMLAGHLILVTFAVLSTALLEFFVIPAAFPFALLVALTGFELLVAFLQAFIFTILTGVYIGGAMHPDH